MKDDLHEMYEEACHYFGIPKLAVHKNCKRQVLQIYEEQIKKDYKLTKGKCVR